MTDTSRTALVQRFFHGTGASYDGMVNAATFGIDRLWKRRMVARIPPDAKRILDLACGTGISTLAIARRFPTAHIVGVELREEYLALARAKVARLGLKNVELVLSPAEDYVSAQRFDCITSSYLAKYAQLEPLVRNNKAMLRPGGRLIMHDFILPPTAPLRGLWRGYFWTLQRLGAPLFPAWREIFYGLPALIEQTHWTEELLAALREHNFSAVRLDALTLHGAAMVTARA